MKDSKIFYLILVGLWLFATASIVPAQVTPEDYERAFKLREKNKHLFYKRELKAHWIEDKPLFWYRNDIRKTKEFMLVDAEQGTRRPAFDHEKLAGSLSTALDKAYTPDNLPFNDIEFVKDGKIIEFEMDNFKWQFDLKTYTCTKGAKIDKPQREQQKPNRSRRSSRQRGTDDQPSEDRQIPSPDGKWEAFVKDYNLYLRLTENGEEYPLTSDGKEDHYYSSKVSWALDSAKLVTYIVKPGEKRIVHYVESSPKDQLQPKHHTMVYAKPGDKITIRKPRLFHVATKKQVEVSDELFLHPYGIDDLHWEKNSESFSFYYNQRGHQVARVIGVDAHTGQTRAIINEQSDTFIDYSCKKYLRYLDDTGEIIWASERDGWSHLYLYDSKTGKVKNQITKGPWVWRGVERVDEEKRQIWFRACGRNPGQDPYFIHYYRINFDGTDLVELTEGNGTHSIEYSPDKKYFIDTYSRVDMPPVHELRRSRDGSLICELERTDITDLLATGWKIPEPFMALSRDDKHEIWGVIYRPTNFDATRKYPVIENIYAGPHGSFVPKRWSYHHSPQALAELGFITVQIDGMGTSNRSRTFHHFAAKNIADAGLPDRIKWMKKAAQHYSYMDISRVGIYGTSAGGQSAAGAVLNHPEFYQAAVASCGCHDNRMDKLWWNEMWMGYPVGPHYAEQSNVTNAYKLQGKLMLIVGEMDKNVDPSSTMQVVDALIKAGKDFDLLVVPGMGHSEGGKYGTRRRWDFFVRHLAGVEPPDWNKQPLPDTDDRQKPEN